MLTDLQSIRLPNEPIEGSYKQHFEEPDEQSEKLDLDEPLLMWSKEPQIDEQLKYLVNNELILKKPAF